VFKIKQTTTKLSWILLLILPAILIQLFAKSAVVANLSTIVQANLLVYLIVILILKSFGIVYPPMPGVALTLASIPLIGWKLAYLLDFTGGMLGATAAYYLGRKYGYSILKRILGEQIVDKIKKTNLKQRNQIEAAIMLRFASGGVLSDGLTWGASLIGFRYVPFAVGYAISHLITTLPIFYFINASITLNSWLLVAVVAILAWLIIYKLKGRYFE
jgi:uncharacterized membrane protein YdjX (TVP38/TMEM64 family)